MIAFFRNFRKRLVNNHPSFAPGNSKVTEDSVAKAYGDNLNNPETLINRANKRATSGDLEGALSDFEDAIALSPAKAATYFNRGFLFHSLEKFESAIHDFSKAIELLPDYDEAYYQRGHSHRQLSDTQRAIQDYSQAIRINPYCIKAYYKRADIRAELDDPAGALNDYGQVIARVPKNANAHYRRGLFLSSCSKFAEAVDDLSTAIDLNPHLADAYFQRGYCYSQLGETEKSSQDYNQAAQYDPSHQAAHTSAQTDLSNKAPLHRPLFKPKTSSIQEATTAGPVENVPGVKPNKPVEVLPGAVTPTPSPLTITSVPTTLERFLDRAQNRFQRGDFGGAIADCTKIINHDPQHSKAYYRRGRSFEALGDSSVAMADLNQSLHLIRTQTLSRMHDFSGELSIAIQTLKQDLKDLSYKRPFDNMAGEQQQTPLAPLQISGAQHPSPVISAPSQPIALTHSSTVPSSTDSTANSSSVSPSDPTIAGQTHLINRNPLDAEAVFNRGHSRVLAGDLHGAIEDYSWTLSLDPNNKEAHVRRARCQSALEAAQAVEADLNAAVHHQSHSSSPTPSPPRSDSDQSTQTNSTQPLSLPSLFDLYPVGDDASLDVASLSLSENQGLPASALSGQKTCNHAGNDPDNLFCIWCGEALKVRALHYHTSAAEMDSQTEQKATPLTSAREQQLKEAESLYQQGLSLFRGKNCLGSLQALSAGLKIFLEQREMQSYQKTLNLMQDVVRSVGHASQQEAIQDDHLLL